MMLIEVIASMALVAIAITFIVGDVATAQRTTTITQNSANLESSMRYVSEYLRSHAPSGQTGCTADISGPPRIAGACAYVLCANTSSYAVPNPLPPLPALNPNNPVTAISLGKAATRDGKAIPPIEDCTTGAVAPPNCPARDTCDWGVQEITIRQVSGSATLVRTVWKSRP